MDPVPVGLEDPDPPVVDDDELEATRQRCQCLFDFVHQRPDIVLLVMRGCDEAQSDIIMFGVGFHVVRILRHSAIAAVGSGIRSG